MSRAKAQPVTEHPSSALGDRTIIRSQHDRDNPYFLMRRDAAQDNTLSWDARGLLAYVLSKADNWKVRLGDLRRQSGAGRDVTRRILKELEAAGYLTRERVRIAHGHFDWVCTVYEKPQAAKKASNSPCPEKPSTVNQPIYKQETVQSREQETTESEKQKRVSVPSSSQKTRRREALNASRYTKKQIRRYVDGLDDVRNPGALTQSLWLSGDADSDIASFLRDDEEWQLTASEESIQIVCDLFQWKKTTLRTWPNYIKAHVVTEFNIWLEAIREIAAKRQKQFDVAAAVELYCEMVQEQRRREANAA